MMAGTVRAGSARYAFAAPQYKNIRYLAGGKTGSLMGCGLKGRLTWFSGLMPYKSPEVIVTALVINSPKWKTKRTAFSS